MAGLIDVFVNYFANPLTWVFMGVFILSGVLIGLFLRPWLGNQVLKFIPGSHRFIDLSIDEETSVSVQCKKIKGMPIQRFFKLHPGYTGVVGRFLKKPITRYLGIEGTAYTWKIKAGEWEKLGTLSDAVRTVWGEDFYSSIPDRQNKILQESKIMVTVGLDESPLTPEGMRSISEEDIKQEEDRQAAKTLWEEHGSQQKSFWVNLFLAGGTGFGLALFLVMIGIIKMPVVTQTTPTNPTTAKMLITAIYSSLKSVFS
jgi:hypothetical protein